MESVDDMEEMDYLNRTGMVDHITPDNTTYYVGNLKLTGLIDLTEADIMFNGINITNVIESELMNQNSYLSSIINDIVDKKLKDIFYQLGIG